MLKRPNYVEGRGGSIEKIFCQVCGDQIAGLVTKPKGSGPNINKLVEAFKRFPNYTEIKMQFDDGTFHVTNGCKECLHMKMDAGLLLEIYRADMQVMSQKPGKRKPVKVVALDVTGSGLI